MMARVSPTAFPPVGDERASHGSTWKILVKGLSSMVCSILATPARGWMVPCFLAGLASWGFTPDPARAQDHFYVRSNGEKVRMVRSDSEYSVVFRVDRPEEINASSRRLAAAGKGVISDVRRTRGGRVQLLRVADVTAKRRGSILDDPDVESVHPVYRFEGVEDPVLCSGTLALKFDPDLSEEQRDRLVKTYRLTDLTPVDGLDDVYIAALEGEGGDEVFLAEVLADDPRTVWAHPNFYWPLEPKQIVANDEFFLQQWHLQTIQAPEAWALSTGQDVLFGIFDDSCDVSHEDLRVNYVGVGHDPSEPPNVPAANDPRPKIFNDRHGTPVIGLAVAAGNSTGGRGVSFLSQFTCSRGLGEFLSDAQIASTYAFARQMNVAVHVNSWGIPGAPNPPLIEEAIKAAFIEGRDPDPEDDTDIPLGMVIVFASGNDNTFNFEGFELSNLPWVIGVNASNSQDRRASYSNFGRFNTLISPSGDNFLPQILTTDNDDARGYPDNGFNSGGFNDSNLPNLDEAGLYTNDFSGTSAACPIAAGVAGLILSVNPALTAAQVRIMMEHTADQIAPSQALYDEITGFSEKYGFGRVNALRASEAAVQTRSNGGLGWPERPTRTVVEVGNSAISWDQNVDTAEFLLVRSDFPFAFRPIDGACYSQSQFNCRSFPALPPGVEVLFVGCQVGEETCEPGARHAVTFEPIEGQQQFFALFARNPIGRYSFGVAADSNGNVRGSGPELVESLGVVPIGGLSGGLVVQKPIVAVTISASPIQGVSPLTVTFEGNAVSDFDIDDSRTAWDFDVTDAVGVDTRSRTTVHTYEVPLGQRRDFIARLSMVDELGNLGVASVEISVDGGESDEIGGQNKVAILSDLESGRAPLAVEMSINESKLVGTLESVSWDLGDGDTADSLAVVHIYQNNTGQTHVFPVSATVSSRTTSGTLVTTTTSKLITVFPAEQTVNDDDLPILDGTGAAQGNGTIGCGAMGLLMPLAGLLSLLAFRRRLV